MKKYLKVDKKHLQMYYHVRKFEQLVLIKSRIKKDTV